MCARARIISRSFIVKCPSIVCTNYVCVGNVRCAPSLKIKPNRSSTDQFSISKTSSKLTIRASHSLRMFAFHMFGCMIGFCFSFMSDLSMSRKNWKCAKITKQYVMAYAQLSTGSVSLNEWTQKFVDNFSCKNRRCLFEMLLHTNVANNFVQLRLRVLYKYLFFLFFMNRSDNVHCVGVIT